MIKIDNDIFYMTAGETCRILKNDGGTLKHVYFGARVELEDDLGALGFGGARDEFRPSAVGKKQTRFVVTDARILTEKPSFDAPMLGGAKTLVIELAEQKLGLRAELYYSTYARGGVARRTVVYNDGDGAVELTGLDRFALDGEFKLVYATADGNTATGSVTAPSAERCVDNFVAAESVLNGDAYGFLCAFGDGALHGVIDGDGATVECVGGGKAIVPPHGRYVSPEVLAVFSDNGLGGATRIMHDVLREYTGKRESADRPPIVLFCPPIDVDKAVDAVGATGELGCDVFAIDVGSTARTDIPAISAACKAAGVKLGISVKPDSISRGGAAFCDGCVKNGKRYSVDLANGDRARAFCDTLAELIEQNDIEYLMIDLPRGGIQSFARGLFCVRRTLAERFPELVAEWGIAPSEQRGGRSLCYPPSMTRNVVEYGDGALKAAFDKATVGCLGYRLDPTALDADKKRAVRAQVFSYQNDAPTVMRGDLYVRRFAGGGLCMTSVTKDKSKAYIVCDLGDGMSRVKLDGLDEHNLYHVRELDKTFSGAALAYCGVPVPKDAATYCLHIRQVADYEN